MKRRKQHSFDAEAALKAATLTVIALLSSWKCHIQECDRDEVIAESVAKAWRRRNTYNPEKASLRTWVAQIARNTLLDFLRRTKSPGNDSTPSVPGDDGRCTEPADSDIIGSETLERIQGAIDSLPESYSQVITLLSEGKGCAEIAEILGCSQNAAAIRCTRARKALMKKLSDEA